MQPSSNAVPCLSLDTTTAAAVPDLSDRQLAKTPDKAFVFLRTITNEPIIRQSLAAYGYSDAQHQLGWDLVISVSTSQRPKTRTTQSIATDAMARIIAWAEPNLTRAHAALEREHPDRVEFLLHDVVARGPTAFRSITAFLERCDALENGNKADKAVLTTLSERGITKQVRKQLFVLVEIVRTEKERAPVAISEADTKRIQELHALHAWLRDWTETARTVVTRRDLLIRLGIAKRRPRRPKNAPIVVAPTPVAPAVTATPASPSVNGVTNGAGAALAPHGQ